MELRDLILSIAMVISAFVLTIQWLTAWGGQDPIIVLSAMVLIGALAAMILSVDVRLKAIEVQVDAKERSLRVGLQSIEESVDNKLNAIGLTVRNALDELEKRVYR